MKRGIWIFGLCVAGSTLVWAQGVQFIFNPPLDKAWLMSMRLTTTIAGETPSSEPLYEEVYDRQWRISISEEAGERWLTIQLERVALDVQGKPQRDVMGEAFRGQPIRAVLDRNGELSSIRGIDRAVELLQATLGSTAPTTVKLEEAYRANWSAELGWVWRHLADQTGELGLSWEHPDVLELVLPRGIAVGAAGASVQWTFTGRQTPAADSPAHLRYSYATEAIAPPEAVMEYVQGWLSMRVPALAGDAWSSVNLTEEGEVLVNPATLIVAEGVSQKRIVFTVKEPKSATLHIDVHREVRTSWVE